MLLTLRIRRAAVCAIPRRPQPTRGLSASSSLEVGGTHQATCGGRESAISPLAYMLNARREPDVSRETSKTAIGGSGPIAGALTSLHTCRLPPQPRATSAATVLPSAMSSPQTVFGRFTDLCGIGEDISARDDRDNLSSGSLERLMLAIISVVIRAAKLSGHQFGLSRWAGASAPLGGEPVSR